MSSQYQADHGESFVPGAGPEGLAPKSLDHFHCGHHERADMRERELSNMPEDEAGGPPPGVGPPTEHHYDQDNHQDTHDNYGGGGRGGGGPGRGGGGPRPTPAAAVAPGGPMKNRSDMTFREYRRYMEENPHAAQQDNFRSGGRFQGRGGGGQHGGGSHVIKGMDIQALVDRLQRANNMAGIAHELEMARQKHTEVFESGKALTAIISSVARRRNMQLAKAIWDWIDQVGIQKNTFHYNSMISACEKVKDYRKALTLMDEMRHKNIAKNEVTFSSAISACEKCGQWRTALELLDQMKKEGAGQTAIAYNAAISACEKGLVPNKAVEIFEQMKREGIEPTVVTYSALISAAEKGQQWKLALEVLEEMKAAGHGANVVAYSAAISALSKGQQWERALSLFREIEASGGTPSIVTYNATMTALEKGLQWERALDLFDEMKSRNLPITVVSYGSAISACDKGLQYRQCLEYLDEMTEMGINKNVIIFGAAMSCMEKCCRADIAFQLMDRMKIEGVAPNVHIYNSAISACARCNLWEKGYELFQEMDEVGVARDVVTYNAVLDAVSSEVQLGRMLFQEGVEKGFYARVSRLGTQWLELDLHFLSLGGGEIALGWWFEECLVPYLVNTSKLEAVHSISIVTGYGKTRLRGARQGDDGMRKRVRAMLNFMKIEETPQPNKGRVHIDKEKLIVEVKKNGGRVIFDLDGYMHFKEVETTSNKFPDVPQKVRPRFRPADPNIGGPPFIRVETESTSPEYRLDPNEIAPETLQPGQPEPYDNRRYDEGQSGGGRGGRRGGRGGRFGADRYDRRNSRRDDPYGGGGGRGRSSYDARDRRGRDENGDRRGSYGRDGRRPSDRNEERYLRDEGGRDPRRGSYNEDRGRYDDRRESYRGNNRRSSGYGEDDRHKPDSLGVGSGPRIYDDRGRYSGGDRSQREYRGPVTWEPPASVAASGDHYGPDGGHQVEVRDHRGDAAGDYPSQPDYHQSQADHQFAVGQSEHHIADQSYPGQEAPPQVAMKQEQSFNAESANNNEDAEPASKKRGYQQPSRGYNLEQSMTKRTRTS